MLNAFRNRLTKLFKQCSTHSLKTKLNVWVIAHVEDVLEHVLNNCLCSIHKYICIYVSRHLCIYLCIYFCILIYFVIVQVPGRPCPEGAFMGCRLEDMYMYIYIYIYVYIYIYIHVFI